MRASRIVAAVSLCLAIAGCSKTGSVAQEEAPKSPQQSLEGVWDFVTSVKWKEAGTSYVRGTLYVKTENNQTVCALTTFEDSETRNALTGSLAEETSSTEQDCQIFASEGVFSIKSSMRRGADTYVPDDFSLRLKGNHQLDGRLISNVDLDATFVKRGSGLRLATPWRMADQDRADRLIAPFMPLMHGKTGCVFGISSVTQTGDAEGGILFDMRRICRSNDSNPRLSDAGDFFEWRQGYYLACKKRKAYTNWKTMLREDGALIKTVYANVDGNFTSVVGEGVPRTGEGAAAKRIASSEMPAKGFGADLVVPETALGIVAQQHCL